MTLIYNIKNSAIKSTFCELIEVLLKNEITDEKSLNAAKKQSIQKYVTH